MTKHGENASGRDDKEVDSQIEQHLKKVYDDALREAVPERLLNLLAELRAKDKSE